MLLGAFEEMRRPRVRELAQEVTGLMEYFALPAGPAAEARNAALKGHSEHVEDEEELRVRWDHYVRLQRYDAYEAACDWWTKWGAALGRPANSVGEQRTIAIPVVQHVQVCVDG